MDEKLSNKEKKCICSNYELALERWQDDSLDHMTKQYYSGMLSGIAGLLLFMHFYEDHTFVNYFHDLLLDHKYELAKEYLESYKNKVRE